MNIIDEYSNLTLLSLISKSIHDWELCDPCKDLHSLGFWFIFVKNDAVMSDVEKVQLFEDKKVRTAWDEEKQEWFFSVVDVCGVLTEQPDYDGARKY